jgi:hypothetical protein
MITVHPNELAITLLNDVDEPRRLKRHKPTDLTTNCNIFNDKVILEIDPQRMLTGALLFLTCPFISL